MFLHKEPVHDDRELVAKLQNANREEAQALLNNRFTEKRRQELLAAAPHDKKGRKVRYYRFIDFSILLQILKTGQHTALDYFDKNVKRNRHYESLDNPVDRKVLYYLIKDYLYFVDESEEKLETAEKLFQVMFKDQSELIPYTQSLFPNATPDELEKVFVTPTYQTVLPFFEKYLPVEYIKQRHAGGMYQKFSTFLSASVGGVIRHIEPAFNEKSIQDSAVYIEFVDPASTMQSHPLGVQGEKEVLFKKIDANQITRVFVSNEQITREVLQDPTSAIGSFYEEHHQDHEFSQFGFIDDGLIIERWRWRENTVDCLPVQD